MDNPKLIREAYQLITDFYAELVIIHEATHQRKYLQLMERFEDFERKYGISIENLIKKLEKKQT